MIRPLEFRTALRRTTVAAAVVAIGLTLLPSASAARGVDQPSSGTSSQVTTAPDTRPGARMVARRSKVYIVGDSITYRSRSQVHKLAPKWEVDGVPSRGVWHLPRLLKQRLAARPLPKHVVIALGSNGSTTWHKQQYVDAVSLLPPTTRVTFTTMWRDPMRWGDPTRTPNKHSKLLRQYSGYVKQIARHRPNTCVFNWRAIARRQHEEVILADGVHPNRLGTKIWARGVHRTVKKCARRPLVR